MHAHPVRARLTLSLLVVLAIATAVPGLTSQAQPSLASPAAAQGHDHGAHARLGHHPAATDTQIAPLLGNLGNHQHRITTTSDLAQRHFDEGLTLAFGFNHAEAIRAFRDAATLDPACAMCYWGIALALGPNINAPMENAAVPDAYAALQKAQELAPRASAAEQAYIRALAARYAPTPVADRASLDRAYADAMRELARQYPDDLDAVTLFAEAVMDLTPWEYWTKDGQATQYTGEIVAALESVLARNPNHPGANHYYIHAVEAGRTPERALPAARRLETLVPGVGHLVHMPAHIYWRTGLYQDAIRVNHHAIHSDETYFRSPNPPDVATHGVYMFGYYPHNIHFVFAAAQMSGQSALALEAARKLVDRVPTEVVRAVPPLEDFSPMPLFALVRFGQWDAILREPAPAEGLEFTRGLWHWARGLAYVHQGQLAQADAEASRLATIAAVPALASQNLFSRSTAATMLELAHHVLAGELAGARDQPEELLGRLQRAVDIQDDLAYMEPPPWYYSVRHSLGAALLQVGQASEAEAVYRADLARYPHNGWSLLGLEQSLRAQGRAAEAAEAQQQFEAAWQHADYRPSSSRF